MFSKVIWPLNLEEPQHRLDGVLGMLKRLPAGHVSLLYVGEGQNNKSSPGEKKLRRLRDSLAEHGFDVDTAYRRGHVATAICAFAEEQDADLIIMPWKPKSSLRIALLGSVVQDVIRLSDSPVAVWKSGAISLKAPSEGLENIMYATAFQAIDNDVIHFLSDKAMNAKKLVLLHVGERAPDPRAEERRRRQVQDNLDRLAGECSLQYGRIETISVLGKPSRQIVRQARSREIDLIVIGKLDNPDSFGSMMGSTAEQLVHRSPCSLLVIPRGAAEGRLQDSRERD
jgi:nucleotide-binding universal stress UspA family protein